MDMQNTNNNNKKTIRKAEGKIGLKALNIKSYFSEFKFSASPNTCQTSSYTLDAAGYF